jgi:Uma2 family endonuclease
MLDLPRDLLPSLPTEEDLPYSDEKPVDNELQLLAAMILRSILMHIWGDRTDWFMGVNLGVYYEPSTPAIGPDAFLALGSPRIRPSQKLRLSYLVWEEKVMPQWVLEIVSQKPGQEYGDKMEKYAAMGVLYYTIYNPSHYRRDKHEPFEVYRLEKGQYIRQLGHPVWMPELGLGIGHDVEIQEGGIRRDWLFWYDEAGNRYPAPEEAIAQERLQRKREQLIRQEIQEQLEISEQARIQAEQARIQAEQTLVDTQQAALNRQRSLIQFLLTQKLGPLEDGIAEQMVLLSRDQLDDLAISLFNFNSFEDLLQWLDALG